MSVKDMLFRVKLDPGQFSKSLKDLAQGVDGLSKKKLDNLQTTFKRCNEHASKLQREIDLIGDAVTKADKKKLGKLQKELKDVQTAAHKAQKDMEKVQSGTSKAARLGDKLRGGVSRLAGGVGASVKGTAAGVGGLVGRAISKAPGATIAADAASTISGSGLSKGAMLLGGGVLAGGLALGAGAVGVGKFAAGGVEAARDAAKIDTNLKQQLGAQGQAGRFGELNDLSGTLQTAMNLDDEDVRQGFTEFLKRGLSVDQLKSNSSLIGDISKSLGITYAEAAEKAAKGLQGDARTLKELGIASTGDATKDAANFSAAAQKKYGGAGANIAKAEGPFAAISLTVSDIQQALGEKIIPMIDSLGGKVMGMLEQWKSDGTLDMIMDALTNIFQFAFDGLEGIISMTTNFMSWFSGTSWDQIFGAIGETVVQVALGAVDTLWNALKTLGGVMMGVVAGLPQLLLGMLEAVWAGVVALAKQAWINLTKAPQLFFALVKEVMLKMMDTVPGIKHLVSDSAIKDAESSRKKIQDSMAQDTSNNLKQLGTDVKAAAISGTQSMRDGVSTAVGTGIDRQQDIFSQRGGAIGDYWANNTGQSVGQKVADRATAVQQAQQQVYGQAGYAGASTYATQKEQIKQDRKDEAAKGKRDSFLKKQKPARQTQTMRITSMDGRINPVGVY